MAFRSLAGSKIIGQGTPQQVPIQLDPGPYKGAIAYGTDGRVYVSDGTAWSDVGSGATGSQGTQGVQGNQGVQGTYGPGFDVIGSVADVDTGGDPQATLNTAFPSVTTGQGAIDETDDELWVYNGTTWVNVGSFRGVQGFQGVQGNQGTQGVVGEEGIQGSRGFRGNQGIQGVQGTIGIQGNQGIQGFQGVQGIQGMQSVQGIQGVQGVQGIQGIQGMQAAQGIQGVQGDVGFQGFNGDDAGSVVEYRLLNNVADADPTQGNMFFNAAAAQTDDFTTVTKIWIDNEAFYGVDLQNLFDAIDASSSTNKAYMKVTQRGSPQNYVIFAVTEVTDKTGYRELDVAFVSGAAIKSDFCEEATPGTFTSYPLLVDFNIAGDRGFQGVQGFQGTTGFQGMQGTQGHQGIQGIQGNQGIQGIQGDTGVQGFIGYSGGLTFNFTYNPSTTEGFPGLNGWLLNSNDVTSATRLYIDDLTETGRRVDELFDFLDSRLSNPKGQIFLRTLKDTSSDDYEFLIYNVSDWTWSPTGTGRDWGHFDITYVASSTLGGTDALPGSSWTSGAVPTFGTTTVVDFIPSGEKGAQGIQGFQGTQGFQGVQGIQGDVGTQGIQGFQGAQGTQGVQGDVGVQGFQGTTGFQGTQGFQGVQGAIGHYGGLTYEWEFLNDQSPGSDPGLSKWKLNNADIRSATLLTIDDVPLNNFNSGVDEVFQWLDAIPGGSGSKGLIVIESFDDGFGPGGHHQVVYEFTDVTSYGDDWYSFAIQYVGQYGVTSFNWQTSVVGTGHPAKSLINFVPRGDAGTQGAQGFQGIQGDFGPQGIQGAQSVQGIQGNQGIQGVQGTEGARDFNVTNLSSIAYVIDGNNNPDLNLLKGFTYRFIVNAPGHPFYIKTNPSTGTADQYNTGVTNNGVDVGTITFRVPGDAPDTLYYQCSIHSGMGGELRTSELGPQGVQGIQGFQGTDGLQGDAGLQGSDGAGSQGIQGFQGDFGFQGTQGFPGPIGPQGIQGTDGIQGGPGFQGSTGGFGGVTFDYTHSTNTVSSDPGVGYLKFNSSNLPSATEMYMDDRDDNFTDIQPFLRTVDDSTSPIKGHYKVSEKNTPSNFAIFTISSLAENSGYFTIVSAFVSGSVSGFANDADVIITFARTGDVGPSGPQGVQGFEGFQGPGGIQGGGGGQGTQGTQGTSIQGLQGFQGSAGFVGGDGTQGTQGTQGVQGRSIQGAEGADGEGIQGVQGIQGRDGVGAQGIQGESGAQGIAGIGATGIQGFQGLQGVANQGVQGNQGTTGPAGFGNQGTQGFQGSQGTTGEIGSQGVQGLPGQGTSGIQGIQGLDGDEGSQGAQGVGGTGNQGTQGFQGAAGIGADGIQGNDGNQGVQGTIGESGVGGTQGVQGFFGIQGFQGTDGGLGETGGQGAQGIQGGPGFQGPEGTGTQGMQGTQGFQGGLGVQGFPGQGTQGIQGTQAAQGVQGERGFQGTQGMQGFGPEGGVKNLQNVHESPLQDTALFIPFFEGGQEYRPLLATLGPNPGGESNFFYTNDADELTVENIQVEGNINVVGTVNAFSFAQTGTDPFHFNTDQPVTLGGTNAAPFSKIEYNSTQNALVMQGYGANLSAIEFRSPTATRFDFDMVTGEFTAAGDISANSDRRLKENIETIPNALDKVTSMRGVYFDMKADPGVRKTGLIAQEVEEVLPEVVKTESDGEQIKSVAYGNIVGLLVEAIKELKDQVDDLKGR